MNITLKKDKLTAVVTTHGAELVELKDENGMSYIWNGDPKYWSGRNPLLFPIVGNLKDGKIRMDGQDYFMGRHGFARDMEFDIVEQGTDFVVLELRSNDETLKKYPRKFVLRVRQILTEDGFTTAFEVKNKDTKQMPFCIGAHTAFRCPLKEGESLEDYQIVFDQEETAYNILLNDQGCVSGPSDILMLDHTRTMPLHYDVFEKLDTIIFHNLRSNSVSLCHSQEGHGIRMDFAGFPMMAFWTKGKERAPFLCVEPWHGCAALEKESGNFEDKEECMILMPEEDKNFSYRVHIL